MAGLEDNMLLCAGFIALTVPRPVHIACIGSGRFHGGSGRAS